MYVVGLKGSPRKKGSTNFLLTNLLSRLEERGAQTRVIDTCAADIRPCREYKACEKKGFCPISDDMEGEIYGVLRQADIIVMASPVFFFGITAQLKALVDRCQVFWARKYRLELKDPAFSIRKGFLLSAGGSRAPRLFDGVRLTARYFFDAVDAEYTGHLTYSNIENRKDLENNPAVEADLAAAAETLSIGFENRTTVLFVGRENSCRSQMAAAFATFGAGGKIRALSGGLAPGEEISPLMVGSMGDSGIDMGFLKPQAVETVLDHAYPDIVVTMDETCRDLSLCGAREISWNLPPAPQFESRKMDELRDDIKDRVDGLVRSLEQDG